MQDLPIVDATSDEEPVSEKERTLGTLSRLLSYPDENYDTLVELLYLLVQNDLPEAAQGISKFGQFVEQCGKYELEENYTRTFDVNPSCALEIGWHLFGEDYMRGQFLVRMREELAKYKIPESTELPDHLTHVLAVVASMPEDEAHQFTHSCVFPALHKMQASLDKNESPYRYLIRCLVLVLEHLFGNSEPWSENDGKIPQDRDAFPGQNGPRLPGQADPLQSYPMPDQSCGGNVEIVPLQMQYQSPGQSPELQDGSQ
jgi:nitrate reductase molybdenum cofactor assembly chaperone